MIDTLQKQNRANLWLFIATAAYFIMNGAQFWETAIMIPAWTAAPPESLFFFKGPYGLDFKNFWIIVHSSHEVLILIALVFNWKFKKTRNLMLLLLVAHMGVRVWTLQYFAPTIIEFQNMELQSVVDPSLVDKAAEWRNLNYLRVGLFFLINLGFAGLLWSNVKRNSNA
ncbi:transposase [Salibacter halophilus]|uniref:Transposase n=1 Tax=Salibacter halophilus TaxID=1803916 RepID=A0A6N6M684_9FLAO|nr:transposase [Salibacter halophilus]KAB1065117.1 transposase [Salibacter halophilus]